MGFHPDPVKVEPKHGPTQFETDVQGREEAFHPDPVKMRPNTAPSLRWTHKVKKKPSSLTRSKWSPNTVKKEPSTLTRSKWSPNTVKKRPCPFLQPTIFFRISGSSNRTAGNRITLILWLNFIPKPNKQCHEQVIISHKTSELRSSELWGPLLHLL